MREGLTHRVDFVFEVMAEDDVRETKIGRRPVWHVRDYEAVWLASCLMHHDKIGEVVSLANFHEIF